MLAASRSEANHVCAGGRSAGAPAPRGMARSWRAATCAALPRAARCNAGVAMAALQCRRCNAGVAKQALQRPRCNGRVAMQALQSRLCNAGVAMQALSGKTQNNREQARSRCRGCACARGARRLAREWSALVSGPPSALASADRSDRPACVRVCVRARGCVRVCVRVWVATPRRQQRTTARWRYAHSTQIRAARKR